VVRDQRREIPSDKVGTLVVSLGMPHNLRTMWNLLSYYWIAARGYILHPWDSPYLRWRLETFLGKEAQDLTASRFLKIIWKYAKTCRTLWTGPPNAAACKGMRVPKWPRSFNLSLQARWTRRHGRKIL